MTVSSLNGLTEGEEQNHTVFGHSASLSASRGGVLYPLYFISDKHLHGGCGHDDIRLLCLHSAAYPGLRE